MRFACDIFPNDEAATSKAFFNLLPASSNFMLEICFSASVKPDTIPVNPPINAPTAIPKGPAKLPIANPVAAPVKPPDIAAPVDAMLSPCAPPATAFL